MPTVRGNTDVAIAGESGNVLVNTDYQFIEGPAIVTVYASSEDYTDVTMQFKVGSLEVVADGVPNTEKNAGEIDRQTDLIVDRQFIPAGRHLLFLNFKNADAVAARLANYLVQIDRP